MGGGGIGRCVVGCSFSFIYPHHDENARSVLMILAFLSTFMLIHYVIYVRQSTGGALEKNSESSSTIFTWARELFLVVEEQPRDQAPCRWEVPTAPNQDPALTGQHGEYGNVGLQGPWLGLWS